MTSISPIRPGIAIGQVIQLHTLELQHILMSLECLQNELKDLKDDEKNREYLEANEVIIYKIRKGLEGMK